MTKRRARTKNDETASSSPEPTVSEQEEHARITKSEAVRRALADGFGQPLEGVAYIKSRYGLDMNPQHFSAVKSAHLKKQGGVRVKVRRGRRPQGEAGVPVAATSRTRGGSDSLIESLEALKPLVATLGADKVKRLVDLLG